MSNYRAGRIICLDYKIDIVKKSEDIGAVENLDGRYEDYIKGLWADKKVLLGSEAVKLGMEHNTVRVNFIIHKRNDIGTDMFIRHEDGIFNIIGFEELDDDRNLMLVATVKKRVVTNEHVNEVYR